jgi:zinc protease
MDKQQAMVAFGFQGTSFHDPDAYGVDVLTAVLGSSFNGRLFMSIREQLGEAYTLGGDFVPGPDAGLIYFYVLTNEEEAPNVTEIVKNQIRDLQSALVPDQELEDIKAYLKGTFQASLETSASLSFTSSLQELYGLGYDHYREYDQRIDAVNREDIRRLANEYLDLNKAAIVVTLPDGDEP